MTRARRSLVRLERSPWTLALIAAAGATLLFPSAAALLGPPEWLDAAVALGDVRLGCALLAFFGLSALLLRAAFRRRRLLEESLDEEPPAKESSQDTREAPPAPARAHLR